MRGITTGSVVAAAGRSAGVVVTVETTSVVIVVVVSVIKVVGRQVSRVPVAVPVDIVLPVTRKSTEVGALVIWTVMSASMERVVGLSTCVRT